MSDPINFEIEELVARYELHPHRKDVFVEGERDQGLLRMFLESEGHADVVVFYIRVVNIPTYILLERRLPHPSRRSEVITLAIELEERNVPSRQVTCIADADFEYLLPRGLQCSLLLLPDFASIELYFFSDDAVHRVLTLVAPNTKLTGGALVASFSGPLQFLFSIRATNFDLQLGLNWIEYIDKFFGMQNGKLVFDENEFMKRYLIDRLPHREAVKFMARLSEIQSQLTPDIRCRIRGHDFIRILSWYLRTQENCKYLNEDSVRYLLYMAIGPSALAAQPMFAALLKRLIP